MSDDPARLMRLVPGGELSARALLDELALRTPVGGAGEPPRARTVGIMVASADGRAAVAGRSKALGHPADRALLRGLRAEADVVLVGTGTIAAEGYGRLLDPDDRERRRAAGRPEHPIVATISRGLGLPLGSGLMASGGVPVLAFTSADAPAPEVDAELRVVRVPAEQLTAATVLDRLAADGARLVVCEGGPTLLALIAAAGRLDDLLLTVAPLLAGGDGPPLLAGAALRSPAPLTLAGTLTAGDHVFLRYRAGAPRGDG